MKRNHKLNIIGVSIVIYKALSDKNGSNASNDHNFCGNQLNR